MSNRQTVPVTTRALVQRINRKLAADHEKLKVTRGQRLRDEVGDFYIVNLFHNRIVCTDVDVEAQAKELGVMKAWESKAD
jgi:hypothetical protein